jgi:type III secretion protein V
MLPASIIKLLPPKWQKYVAIKPNVEAIIAIGVVGVVFMMILPLPEPVMDVLISVNLFNGAMMIVLSLYVASITSFTTFPVVLLISTLFRLGIEISASRMILLHASAGAIVDTFGNFVVEGNLVVGLVVFLIVTVVQFIVVTKGGERISEVSARFTLDAMPAKQLAIESELRGGHIDKAEAKRQRQLLDTETTLLGAMDGTLKFVKGDSIAGLIIVAVNLIGGLSVGIFMKGMPAGEAVVRYSVLTIGEGLVAQIPALLSSMTAAILVSRINGVESKSRGASFGTELMLQFRHANALFTVSGVMLAFAMIPGMPTLTFLSLAAGAGFAAFNIKRKDSKTGGPAKQTDPTDKKRAEDTTNVTEFNQMDALQLALPQSTKQDDEVQNTIRATIEGRNQLVLTLGMSIPTMVTKFDPTLTDTLEFRVYEVPVYRTAMRQGQLALSGRYAEMLAHRDDAVLEPGAGPAGSNVVWLPASVVEADPELKMAAMTWHAFIADKVQQRILKHGPRFTGVQTGQKYMTWMQSWMPDLAKELEKSVPIGKLAEVVQRLLKERVAIRNMRAIMECLADHGQRERDASTLCELVRFALREQICHHVAPNGHLDVFVLTPELEEYLTGCIRQTANGGFLALNPHETSMLSASIRATIGARLEPGQSPVLVCAQDIRRYVRGLLENDFPDITVLSLTELTPEVSVRVIGSVEATPPSDDGMAQNDPLGGRPVAA